MLLSLYYLLVFVLAAVIVIWSTPLVRAFALQHGYVDLPGTRKVHRRPIVRLGGIAICIGTLIPLILVFGLGGFDHLPPETVSSIGWVMLGSSSFFLIGLVDDLIGLSPLLRLFMQGGVSSLIWMLGVQIEFLTVPGMDIVHLGWLSLPVTVIWLTGVVNAINWIDGLDGLASGVSGIAAAALFTVCLFTGDLAAAAVVIALAGSLLGFLYYNFNPAQIFMGDSGSYFIGFTIAGISVVGLVKSAAATAILIPLFVLAVPILDMSAVIVARLCNGRSPFRADRRHLHHRLLQAGLSHRFTVLVIYVLTFWSGSLAIAFAGVPTSTAILASATGLLGCTTWKAFRSIRH
ncbi:undecaprenyl/decaprenyl-phosphate alpha-N-acetylglucosaminyl 1-phosphate transferase [Oculatella sp. LEGE 06141]|uniref:glycosyltransferase family 4 protein n=1 Tax=Oculatella sp. LEGE 06141 TaxID=1828648 RepID=UPI001882E34E|nr:MraY family glycosyltransferase [Oculatella sp. LEGE 06141]MBE9179503.1 undecaprenyl/decaprenyl-phosphate alpha-N-acetylglucosaminyl 1-phosphate transferase [Oculatella sp. LEGE 06141]